jgi:hypothetical protein
LNIREKESAPEAPLSLHKSQRRSNLHQQEHFKSILGCKLIVRYPTFCKLAGIDPTDGSPKPPKAIDPALGPSQVRKNASIFAMPFDTKNDHFTKTGSGQT